MRPCAALIFDFDGVIVESEHIKAAAFAALYGEHGPGAAETASAYHLANGGISRRKKIRHLHRSLLGVELAADALDALCARFSHLVEDAVVACAWIPGACTVLQMQTGRRPMFVVSGTPHAELQRIVGRRAIAHHFTEVHGSPPDKTTTVSSILDRHRLDPRSVLFVGDALADWQAARNTGTRFIGVLHDRRASPFPEGTPLIRDLTQLVP